MSNDASKNIGLNWTKSEIEPPSAPATQNVSHQSDIYHNWKTREVDDDLERMQHSRYRSSMSTLDFDDYSARQTSSATGIRHVGIVEEPQNEQKAWDYMRYDNVVWSEDAKVQYPQKYIRTLMGLKQPTPELLKELAELAKTDDYQRVLLADRNESTKVKNISVVANDVHDDLREISHGIKKRKSWVMWGILIFLCVMGFAFNDGTMLSHEVGRLVEGFINATVFCAIMSIIAKVSRNNHE